MGRGKAWTPAEDDYLRGRWGVAAMTEIAKALGRTREAVRDRRRRIGLPLLTNYGASNRHRAEILRRVQDGEAALDVARSLGMAPSALHAALGRWGVVRPPEQIRAARSAGLARKNARDAAALGCKTVGDFYRLRHRMAAAGAGWPKAGTARNARLLTAVEALGGAATARGVLAWCVANGEKLKGIDSVRARIHLMKSRGLLARVKRGTYAVAEGVRRCKELA